MIVGRASCPPFRSGLIGSLVTSIRRCTITPVVGDIIRVVCVYSFGVGGDQFTNTFHFKVLAASWVDNLAFMTQVAAFLDAAYQIINVNFPTEVVYLHIDGQNITQAVLMPLVPWPVLVAGANVTDALPSQATARPYFPTTRPKTRAAIGLPPYAEGTQTNGGLLDAGAISTTVSWAAQFVGNILLASGTIEYGPFNRPLNRFVAADSAILPSRFRTLKRRRIGVGS